MTDGEYPSNWKDRVRAQVAKLVDTQRENRGTKHQTRVNTNIAAPSSSTGPLDESSDSTIMSSDQDPRSASDSAEAKFQHRAPEPESEPQSSQNSKGKAPTGSATNATENERHAANGESEVHEYVEISSDETEQEDLYATVDPQAEPSSTMAEPERLLQGILSTLRHQGARLKANPENTFTGDEVYEILKGHFDSIYHAKWVLGNQKELSFRDNQRALAQQEQLENKWKRRVEKTKAEASKQVQHTREQFRQLQEQLNNLTINGQPTNGSSVPTPALAATPPSAQPRLKIRRARSGHIEYQYDDTNSNTVSLSHAHGQPGPPQQPAHHASSIRDHFTHAAPPHQQTSHLSSYSDHTHHQRPAHHPSYHNTPAPRKKTTPPHILPEDPTTPTPKRTKITHDLEQIEQIALSQQQFGVSDDMEPEEIEAMFAAQEASEAGAQGQAHSHAESPTRYEDKDLQSHPLSRSSSAGTVIDQAAGLTGPYQHQPSTTPASLYLPQSQSHTAQPARPRQQPLQLGGFGPRTSSLQASTAASTAANAVPVVSAVPAVPARNRWDLGPGAAGESAQDGTQEQAQGQYDPVRDAARTEQGRGGTSDGPKEDDLYQY